MDKVRSAWLAIGLMVLMVLAVVVGLMVGAQAQACGTFTIGRIDGTSHILGRADVPGVSVSLEGHYLWVVVGEIGDPLFPEHDTISHDVAPDVVGATVCPDGSVSFEVAPVVTEAPAPIEAGVEDQGTELLSESEIAELRPETREIYAALHPGTGGVQEF